MSDSAPLEPELTEAHVRGVVDRALEAAPLAQAARLRVECAQPEVSCELHLVQPDNEALATFLDATVAACGEAPTPCDAWLTDLRTESDTGHKRALVEIRRAP